MPSCVPAASPGTRAAAEDAVEETDSIRFTGRGDLERRGTGQEVGVATELPPRALRCALRSFPLRPALRRVRFPARRPGWNVVLLLKPILDSRNM